MATSTITHVVLVQWRADASPDALAQLAPLINSFPTEIPGVVGVAHGPSVSPEGLEGDFEWGLVVTFVSAAARDAYLPHPAHAPVATVLGANAQRLVVFDVAT